MNKNYLITTGALIAALGFSLILWLSLARDVNLLKVRVDLLELKTKSMEAGTEALKTEIKAQPTIERK